MPGALTGDIVGDYDLSLSVDELRDTYVYNETCQGTVPQAIRCYLEAESFEDAIRNAISIGGDSDTLAAITGSVAEGTFGGSEEIAMAAVGRLDQPLHAIVARFYKQFIPQYRA